MDGIKSDGILDLKGVAKIFDGENEKGESRRSKKMKRMYTATWDDGHDYGEFDYYSEHRAKSKANMQDAYETMWKKYGYFFNKLF